MLYISAFTFGGGFVIVSIMKQKFVDEKHYLTMEEMLDITALAESSPGAIAVNAAIICGWKLRGLRGMIVSVFGVIIPPLFIISLIYYFYNTFITNTYIATFLKGCQAGVAALILNVSLSLGERVIKNKKIIEISVIIISFLIIYFTDINVIYLIIASIIIGLISFKLEVRK